MNIELWCTGKTHFNFIKESLDDFSARIKHYCKFNVVYLENIKPGKNESPDSIKEKEGIAVLKKIDAKDYLILLDEKGMEMNSLEFAEFIEKKMIYSDKKIKFLIGGAYGFSREVYSRADEKLSLSRMTFSHQIIRLIFAEQLYRAFTIIKNEKYHNN